MMHFNREWSFREIAIAEELADKLSSLTWCCCQAFSIGNYLLAQRRDIPRRSPRIRNLLIKPDGSLRGVVHYSHGGRDLWMSKPTDATYSHWQHTNLTGPGLGLAAHGMRGPHGLSYFVALRHRINGDPGWPRFLTLKDETVTAIDSIPDGRFMPPIRCLPNGDPVVLLQRFVDSGVDVVRREKDGWQRVVSVPRPVLVLSWEMAENGDVVVLSRSADSSELHLSRSDSQRWDEEVLLKIEAAETLLGAFVITVSWLIVPEIADGFGRVGVVFKRMRQRRLDRPKRRAPVASAKVESVVPQRVEHAGSKNDMQSPPPVDLQKQAEELQRRKDARLKCLFEWEAAASALENRFPRERLVEYFNTYMSTQHSVEVVEARAAQLLALLKSILRSCSAPQTMHFESLKELLAHFDRVREEIAATHADELIVQTLEAVAETGRIKAIEEYLKR